MTDVLPEPADVLKEVLVELAVRAAERAWRRLTTRRNPGDLSALVAQALRRLSFEDRAIPIEPIGLDSFLRAPEAVGVVERLLAFRILDDLFPRAPAPAQRPMRTRKLNPEEAAKAAQVERELNEIMRRNASGPRELSSHDAQADALRRETARILDLWFGLAPDHPERNDGLFAALSSAADAAYEAIAQKVGGFPDRRVELIHWLNSVVPRLQLLSTTDTIRPILEFEANLRLQAARHHQWLRSPHLGREVRLTQTDAYISPRVRLMSTMNRNSAEVDSAGSEVSPEPTLAAEASGALHADELLVNLDRAVVIGDPGAGKSSLGASICYRTAAAYATRPVAGRLVTPIFVALRDYAPELRSISIAELLDVVVRARYQLTPPLEAIPYLLSHGRLLIVFDGLDELVDKSDRQRARDAIESFAYAYPMTRILVTARNIGYSDSRLDSSEFTTYELLEFDQDQIEEYARRWFALQPELAPGQRERQVMGFLRESAEHARDLRRNPLLLALLCAVYRGEGYLPRSRPAIYQRCVELLLRQWDALRQIKVDEPLGEHLERTLRQIAYWLYHEAGLANGITEDDLVRRCARFIAEIRTGDLDEAAAIAKSFIAFCRERAWVLVEIGHNEDGEAIFGFAHRTFLEYFAAQQLQKQSRTPTDLAAALPLFGSTSVVPHLALQLANESRDDAADEIVTYLLDCADDESSGTYFVAVWEFVLEALRFVIPRPPTTRRVGREIAFGLLRPTLVDTTRYDGSIAPIDPWPGLVSKFGAISNRNVRAAAAGFREGLGRALRQADQEEAFAALSSAVSAGPSYLQDEWTRHLPELAQLPTA